MNLLSLLLHYSIFRLEKKNKEKKALASIEFSFFHYFEINSFMDVPLFKQFVLWRGERRLVVGEEDLQTNRIASVFKVSAAKLVIPFAAFSSAIHKKQL